MCKVIVIENSIVWLTDVCLAVHEGKEECSQNETSVKWHAKNFWK